MNTYNITIKDLSAITSQSIYEATITTPTKQATELITALSDLIQEYADNLDTTPDMIEILHIQSIINPLDIPR
jgi:hypothetical protein